MTTTLQFLRALYPDPVGPGQLLVWMASKRRGNRRSYWVHTLDEAADHAHRLKRTRDVHFSLALHDPITARAIVRRRWPKVQLPSVRGSHDSAVALPALWAEISAGGQSPSALPLERALRALDAVPGPPSILVDAGGSLQVYWLLRELWTLQSDAARARARDLLRRLHGALEDTARLEGLTLGADGAPARQPPGLEGMLRVPGTLNHDSATPSPVSIIRFPLDSAEARYTPEDFDDLPPAPEPPPAASLSAIAPVASPARFEPMFEGCRFLQDCYEAQDRIDERRWQVALGFVGRSESVDTGGDGLAHDFSRGHPGYNPLKTEEMLEHALLDLEPWTCADVEDAFDADGDLCGRCDHRGRIENPVVLGQRSLRLVATEETAAEPASDAPSDGGPVARASSSEIEPAATAGESGGDLRRGPLTIVVDQGELTVDGRVVTALPGRAPDCFEHGGVVVVVAVARPEAPGAVRRGAFRPRGDAQGAGDLVHGLADVLGPLGGSATVREILDQVARSGDAFPTLRAAFRGLFPDLADGELPSPSQLAGHLRNHRGRVVRGAFIDQASKSYKGVNWAVRRAA